MKKIYHLIIAVILVQKCLADTIIVNTSVDEFDTPSGGTVSLREAIRDLGGVPGRICIQLPITKPLVLESPLVIEPAGGALTIEGASGQASFIELKASNSFAGFSLIENQGRVVTLRNFHLNRSVLSTNDQPRRAVDVMAGSLTLDDSEIRNWNFSSVILRAGSAGIFRDCLFSSNNLGIETNSAEKLSVSKTLFYSNIRAISVRGNFDSVELTNSTFAENLGESNATVNIAREATGSVSLSHCSFVDNGSAAFWGPPSSRVGHCLFARNTPFDGNGSIQSVVEFTDAPAFDSQGYNLADDSPASLNQDTDIKGQGSLVRVSRLGDFGGERYCCFPLKGSPAIEGGNPNRGLLPSGDGRGFARKARTRFTPTAPNIVDIGAVEVNPEGSIIVSNYDNDGPGSFREAVTSSSGETAHIIFNVPGVGVELLEVETSIVFDVARNFNIDSTTRAAHFTAPDDTGPILLIDGDSLADDEEVSVSLLGVKFVDFSADSSSNRGCIHVREGGILGLNRCQFEGNSVRMEGVVDVESGRVFANECVFSDNTQRAVSETELSGGAALQVTDSSAVVWNSIFLRNVASGFQRSNTVGGAVQLSRPKNAVFRQCTFARNKAQGGGAAVYLESISVQRSLLIIDRCTIAENQTTSGTQRGAIAVGQFAEVWVGHCLFSENSWLVDDPVKRDFTADEPGSVTVISLGSNWTNLSNTYPGLVSPENLGARISLAPPRSWGGRTPTMPMIESSDPVSNTADSVFSHIRDTMNLLGFGANFRPNPGAVQLRLPQSEVLDTEVTDVSGGSLRLRVSGRAGITWIVEGSTDLERFVPTGDEISVPVVGESLLKIALPSPNPDAWFLRFREKITAAE